MRWPPAKAWSSTTLREGYRHFVAINYGGIDKKRWVLLVSVLDGKSRFTVKWSEMKDPEKWVPGWTPLSRCDANPNSFASHRMKNELDGSCLHPSNDSGLLIPSEKIEIRPWNI